MKPSRQQGQGALEYLLLIGGAVVVAVIVIFLLIGIAGSTGNAANSTVQTGIQNIQDVLRGDGFCNLNGACEISLGENSQACSDDCYCGDTICDSTEDATNCMDDCT